MHGARHAPLSGVAQATFSASSILVAIALLPALYSSISTSSEKHVSSRVVFSCNYSLFVIDVAQALFTQYACTVREICACAASKFRFFNNIILLLFVFLHIQLYINIYIQGLHYLRLCGKCILHNYHETNWD